MFDMFISADFKPRTMRVIEQANDIIAEYQEAGIGLTLRSLFYQFVSRDLMPNKQSEYKRLGDILNKGRLAGLVDWDALEDETRQLRSYQTEESPAAATLRLAKSYIEDLWENQPIYVEQWIEKDAGLGTIRPAVGRWRLPHFSCRGFASQTAIYEAAQRLSKQLMFGKRVVILHIGDHDPSGIDMTRDIRERLNMLARCEDIEIERIALNMDQIRFYKPPPNPAKESDSRMDGYLRQFNTRSSWELDALDPKVIDGLIEQNVRGLVDIDLWDQEAERERINREKMFDAARAMESDEDDG